MDALIFFRMRLFDWLKAESVRVCVQNPCTCTLYTQASVAMYRLQWWDKVHVLCLQTVCYIHEHTHTHTVNTNCSRLCVWFMRSGPVLADEWRPKGFVATRTHGNSPSTLSPTTPSIEHICLSVQPWLGKSLTQRPSGLLKATDQTKIENKRKKY